MGKFISRVLSGSGGKNAKEKLSSASWKSKTSSAQPLDFCFLFAKINKGKLTEMGVEERRGFLKWSLRWI